MPRVFDSSASNKASLSVDDKIAEKIVSESIKKVEGRYMLRMPFRTKPSTIPNNRTMAETRMKYLHRKLQRDSKLKKGYVKTVQGYISAGYARKVPPDELAQDTAHGVWYIPHHAVVNPKKPGKNTRCVRLCS